jgi:glycosyltransferase involved in cell wall biosynthesis
MKKISMCQLFGSYNYAGISRVAVELALRLQKKMDVTLACRKIERNVEEDINLVELTPKNTFELWAKAEDLTKRYDIIHTHDVYSLPGLLKNKGNAKIVYTEHGLIPLKYCRPNDYLGTLFAHICRRFSKKPDLAVGISDYLVDELNVLGFKNVIKIPNGVDLGAFSCSADKNILNAEQQGYPLLLKVGLIDKHRATNYHIDSMHFVLEKYPNASLLFAGVGDINYYREKTRRANLSSSVKFLGFVNRKLIPLYYNVADVVLSVDYVHGFGLPILEGMACGKPIIARNSYAMREHILNSGGGVLVEGQHPREVALALEKILSNYAFYSSRATSYAKQFDWSVIVDRYCAAYESILNCGCCN